MRTWRRCSPTAWPSGSSSPSASACIRSGAGSAAHLPGSDVSVDNEASETATVLEVRAPDEIGLLHRITRALFDSDLDVVSARVSTLGEMVVDAFYVRESGGSKVTDASRLSEITEEIRAELGL